MIFNNIPYSFPIRFHFVTLSEAQKETRRRRRRGASSPEVPSRFNWRLWGQCLGSILLMIVCLAFIVFIIIGLLYMCAIAAEGGGGGGVWENVINLRDY